MNVSTLSVTSHEDEILWNGRGGIKFIRGCYSVTCLDFVVAYYGALEWASSHQVSRGGAGNLEFWLAKRRI